MLSTVTFKREDTGKVFTFGPHPPYQLHPNTKLPAPGILSVSGVEYLGSDGGQTLASRLQRQPVKIVYNVLESYKHDKGMVRLLADASAFFQSHDADLSVIKYTMIVQTCDADHASYMMQHGTLSTPFSAPLIRGIGLSVANEMDFIFDDPYKYWTDGVGVVSDDIYAALPAGTVLGEEWHDGLQVWNAGLSQWEYPHEGTAGTPQTINVTSSVTVGVEIAIYGGISHVRIDNDTNGSYWQWDQEIPKGRTVRITSDGTARDWNGDIIYTSLGRLTASPGDNTFSLAGQDIDGGYANVTVRGAY